MHRVRGCLLVASLIAVVSACLALATRATAVVGAAPATDAEMLVVPHGTFRDRLAREVRTSPWAGANRAATPDRTTGLDGSWVEVPPPARADHIAIYDAARNRMVVVAGHPDDPRRGVWTLALTGTPQWVQVPAAGTPPPGIYAGAGAYDSARDRILVWDSYKAPASLERVYALSLATMTWSEVPTTGGPPPYRVNQSMVYDPVRDRMIAFAGWDYEHAYQDVWTLSMSGTPTWAPLVPSGAPPPARFSHVAIYDPVRDRMIAFGGYAGPDSVGAVFSIGGTWELTLGGVPAWNLLAPSGTAPTTPARGAAAYDPVRDRMLFYGGEFADAMTYGFSRGLSALSFSPAPEWQRLTTAAPAGRPLFTEGNSAIYDPGGDRLVIFGGIDANGDYYGGPLADAWTVTVGATPTWSRFTPATTSAAGRIDRTAIYDSARNRMVLFGGGENIGDYCCEAVDITTWAYDLQFATWQGLDTKANRPPARMGHAAIYDPVRDRMIITSGSYSTQTTPIDLRALSFSGDSWSVLAPTGTQPLGRSFFSVIYDPVRDRLIVFGGESVSPLVIWNDVWTLRMSDLHWEQILPAGPLPSPRHDHMAIYDPTGDRMIVFGGAGYGPPDYLQAWALSLSGSPAWTPLGAPSPAPDYVTSRQVGTYDPLRQRMIVTGGLLDAAFGTETWALSLAGPPIWTRLDVGSVPLGSDHLAVIYDPFRDRLLAPDWQSSQLYALEFPPGGPTPTLVSLVSAEAVPGRARIVWQVSAGGGQAMSVSRRSAARGWEFVGEVVADAVGRVVFEDASVESGTRYGYRVALAGSGAAAGMGEVWVEVPAAPRLALRGAVPNPASHGLRLEFSLASDARARLEVIDIAGRRVASREVGALGAGAHALALDEAGTLRPGLYLVRLTQAGESRTTRALVVP